MIRWKKTPGLVLRKGVRKYLDPKGGSLPFSSLSSYDICLLKDEFWVAKNGNINIFLGEIREIQNEFFKL